MENKQAHAGTEQYDEKFYRGQSRAYGVAKILLPICAEYVRPRTVIDVGCGTGVWSAVWQKNFGAEIYGIDGDYVNRAQLIIDKKFFHPANLEERITLDRRFDLAMSLEVAEHLLPSRADSFVEDLTRLSDVILFSAAIPVQGGTNHVNEQWQSYWAEKFLRFGYVVVDCLRPKIWDNERVAAFYRQNILMYVKSTELYRYPELQDFYLKHRDATVLDIVHPKIWLEHLLRFQRLFKQVQAELTKTPPESGEE